MELSCPHCDEKFEFDWEQVDQQSNDMPCPHCHVPIPYSELSDPTIDVSLPGPSPKGFAAYEEDLPADPLEQLANFDLTTDTGPVHGIHNNRDIDGTHTIYWSLGVILLSLILVMQLLWFIRADLREVPQLRSWVNLVCSYIECKLPPMTDVSLIHILSSDIRTHPTDHSALELNLVIESKTEFDQPFPVIELNLTGARGQLIASRQFEPHEYIFESGLTTMPNHRPIHVSLEIREPKQRVAGYSFRFYAQRNAAPD